MPGALPPLLPAGSADLSGASASSSGFQTAAIGGGGNPSASSAFQRTNSLGTGAGEASDRDMQSAAGDSARAGPGGVQHYDMFDSNSEHFSMHTAGLNIDE